jgi:hypothetical protein
VVLGVDQTGCRSSSQFNWSNRPVLITLIKSVKQGKKIKKKIFEE